MRSDGNHLDQYRKNHPTMGDSDKGSLWGYFVVGELRIISSGERHASDAAGYDDGLGEWEHVSISLPDRCPTWEEMCQVKDLFWMRGECVVQFHPPEAVYINNMRFCLHLWKSPTPIELPPSIAVGYGKSAMQKLLRKRLNR